VGLRLFGLVSRWVVQFGGKGGKKEAAVSRSASGRRIGGKGFCPSGVTPF